MPPLVVCYCLGLELTRTISELLFVPLLSIFEVDFTASLQVCDLNFECHLQGDIVVFEPS